MWHCQGVCPLIAGPESHVLLLVHVSASALVELLWRLLLSQSLSPPLVMALWVSIVILVMVACFPLAVSVYDYIGSYLLWHIPTYLFWFVWCLTQCLFIVLR